MKDDMSFKFGTKSATVLESVSVGECSEKDGKNDLLRV